jgi:hypothetical protein
MNTETSETARLNSNTPSINANSYTTKTNIQFGSAALKDTWWAAQSFTLPAITMAPPRVNSRSGAMINLAPDTTEYGELMIDAIIDKEWKVYKSLYEFFVDRLNVESGQFIKFGQIDIWVETYNGEGKKTSRFDFYNCRLTNFGEVDFNTTNADDEHNYLTLGFTFDYFDFNNTFRIKQSTDLSLDPLS